MDELLVWGEVRSVINPLPRRVATSGEGLQGFGTSLFGAQFTSLHFIYFLIAFFLNFFV